MKEILLVGFVVVWIYGGVVAMMDGCAGFGGDVVGMVVVVFSALRVKSSVSKWRFMHPDMFWC